jgi:translocation and assembly module TamB
VLVCVGVAVLQSSWFKEKIRLRIVSETERASGGQVEIGAFNFDWPRLTASIDGFVLHGTEPKGDAPLFRAEHVLLRLKLVSILSRDVKIRSLQIEKPQIALLVHPDGTTNIPPPRFADDRTLPEQILDLAIGRFELRNGTFALNAQKYPLDVRGEQFNLQARYDRAGRRYAGTVSSSQVAVASSRRLLPVPANVRAEFEFAKDRARFDHAIITVNNSTLEAAGSIRHFANPEADAKMVARVDASEFGTWLKSSEVSSGTILVSGNAAYRMHSPSFAGSLSGRDLRYRNGRVVLNKVNMQSQISVDQAGVRFDRLVADAPDGSFSGEAALHHFREFRLNGQIRNLQFIQLSRLLSRDLTGWSGVASGPVQLAATVGGAAADLQLTATANIVPRGTGIPVSGSAEVQYQQRGKTLRLGNSHFDLPHSSIDVSGTVGETLRLKLDSADLHDFQPAWQWASGGKTAVEMPVRTERGHARFEGTLTGPLRDPNIDGQLSLRRVEYGNSLLDNFDGTVGISSSLLTFENASAKLGGASVTATGQFGLSNWRPNQSSPFRIHGTVANADLRAVLAHVSSEPGARVDGTVGATLDLGGTLAHPSGTGHLRAVSVTAYGEHIDGIAADLAFSGNRVTVEKGTLHNGEGAVGFRGSYTRGSNSWSSGELQVHLDTHALPLASIGIVRRYQPDLTGNLDVHLDAAAYTSPHALSLNSVNGEARVKDVAIGGIHYGSVSGDAVTKEHSLEATVTGNLQDAHFSGSTQVGLQGDYPARGTVQFGALHVRTVRALLHSTQIAAMPLDGLLEGKVAFSGALSNWRNVKTSFQLDTVRISPELAQADRAIARNDLTLQNSGPVTLELGDGTAVLHSLRLTGKDTQIDASGRLNFGKGGAIEASANGTMNLQVLQLFDPTLVSSGVSNLQVGVSGTLAAPAVDGTLEFRDASLNFANFPNGLDHANGSIRFDQHRATIQNLSASSGGGNLSLGGFVTFGNGPLVYRLEAAAENVRVRYAGAVSVTFNTNLKFTGTAQQSLLSGTLTVTRAAVSDSADLGSVFAAMAGAAAAPASENTLLRGVQMDVRVESAPSLQLSTSLSQDVQAEIDLRLRGAPNRPVVLGRVSMNEGQIQVFGNKYTINRGEIDFVNPAKLDPVLDLVLETQARGVTVNIAVNGTLNKLNVSYRSDPPLQSSEIIALLAVGRAPDQTASFANSRPTAQAGFLSAGTDTLLGQAVSPASSSLQRFFGVTHLKIDPQLQGIENVPQARLTMEQQISREITITYVTNLSRTSEQIFRLEWALGRQYSFVAIRDENGLFGVDLQYKRRFK